MQNNEMYPAPSITDEQLRIEALAQARNAFHGSTAEEITAAARAFYDFLKG